MEGQNVQMRQAEHLFYYLDSHRHAPGLDTSGSNNGLPCNLWGCPEGHGIGLLQANRGLGSEGHLVTTAILAPQAT